MTDIRTSGFGNVPKGNTSNRSSRFPSPLIGDVYYNGELEILEIYNGSSWVAVSAPPATPSVLSVTDVGTVDYSDGGTFTVVVTPGTGGSTALQYNASTSSGGFSGSSSSTTISLSGLTPGTNFVVVSSASNNFGTTVNSAPFSSTLATTRPQAPTIGTATASSSANEITVTWTLGSNGGKNISSITITPYLNGVTAQTPRTASTTSSTSYTFSGNELTANSSYTFKVKTTNDNGDSPESSASNSAIMPNVVVVDYLVIAGGGSGGTGSDDGSSEGAGGGGAGGYLTATGSVLSKSTNYQVTVGSGGSSVGTGLRLNGNSGANSVFNTVTAIGGGFGGKGTGGTGGTGGSGGGGGGGSPAGSGGSRTSSPVQGNIGGSGSSSANGGGGGGAGTAGFSGQQNGGGERGGNGLASSITGTSVTRAGGGGGGAYSLTTNGDPDSDGLGGSGGGGNGGGPGSGTSGSINTGSGGGGAGRAGSYISGSGGSGIVILRYLATDGTITIGSGLTGSTATDGLYRVTTITAGSGNVSWS